MQSLTLLVLPFQLQNMGVFIAFLLVLYLRPQGLFGRRAAHGLSVQPATRGWLGIARGGRDRARADASPSTERYHHRVLTLVFLWATMGLAWNIISGYAGQISFGHQAFFGIGAYVTVLLVVKLGLTPWIGMVVGVGVPRCSRPCSSACPRSGWPASTSGSPRSPTRSSSAS